MATQETSLRDQEGGAQAGRAAAGEKISLVVDRPSPDGRGLLILPFATARSEEAIGRQIGLIVQHRLQAVPELTVGHGQLVTTLGGARRYLPLYRILSAQQALACGASWRATAVLYGAITVHPALRWSVILQDVGSGQMLFEDTLVGEPEDLLDAPGDVGRAVTEALGLPPDETEQVQIDTRETQRLDALLTYLQAVDLRPQHGINQTDAEGVRRQLLRALVLDTDFKAPANLLIADVLAGVDNGILEQLAATMDAMGSYGATAVAILARALEEQGHSEPATVLSTAVLEQDPLQEIALPLAAQQAYRAGHFARARRLVHSLLDQQPDSALAHELLGNLLAAADRFPGAAQHWELSLEANPNQPKVMIRLGSYLAAAGEYQRSYDLLCQTTATSQASSESLYQLGVVAYRLGLVREAIAALHLALQRDPDRANAHVMLARCYLRAGRGDLALVHDGRALELLPSYWPSALALGYAALSRGQSGEALAAYTLVARIRPDLPEALLGLGNALVANSMAEDGIAVLLRARELRPEDVDIACALGLAYLRAGQRLQAEQTLAAASDLAPASAQVARCMRELYGQRPLGGPEQAWGVDATDEH